MVALLWGSSLGACSQSDDPDGAVPDDTGTSVDMGVADAGVEFDSGSCRVEQSVDPTPDPACPGRWTTVLGGVIADEQGARLEDGKGQMCIREAENNVLTCLRPITSCAEGRFELVVPEAVRCIGSLVVRVFDPASPDLNSDIPGSFADTFCNVGLPSSPAELRIAEPFVLYRTTPVLGLPAEGDRAETRTVRFEGGLEVDVTPAMIFGDWGYDRLASRRLQPSDPTPCFNGPADPAFRAVWGFTPNININGDIGFPLRVRDTGLAEGTMVDLYVLGSIDCALTADFATVVEEGRWARYTTVTIDQRGDFAANLPCFNWFAYAVRPS